MAASSALHFPASVAGLGGAGPQKQGPPWHRPERTRGRAHTDLSDLLTTPVVSGAADAFGFPRPRRRRCDVPCPSLRCASPPAAPLNLREALLAVVPPRPLGDGPCRAAKVRARQRDAEAEVDAAGDGVEALIPARERRPGAFGREHVGVCEAAHLVEHVAVAADAVGFMRDSGGRRS